MKVIPTTHKAKKTHKPDDKNHPNTKDTMKDDIIAIMELMLEYSRIEDVKHPSKSESA